MFDFTEYFTSGLHLKYCSYWKSSFFVWYDSEIFAKIFNTWQMFCFLETIQRCFCQLMCILL